jgi:hypothetical protein
MINRGPGFLYDLAPPLTAPPSLVSLLDWRHTGRLRKRELRKEDNLLTGRGVMDGGGAKSYDGEKSWSSINH